MKRLLLTCVASLMALNLLAQTDAELTKARRSVDQYFRTYTPRHASSATQSYLKNLSADSKRRTVTVIANDEFSQQEFTQKQVDKIYKKVRGKLPKEYRKYNLTIKAAGLPIEQYVSGRTTVAGTGQTTWGNIRYDGQPWVRNVSSPVDITHGLDGRHITIWQSHGRYYSATKGKWEWQRPYLFGTTEDLYTQTIVVPYLIPMLERAGAVVFTPRERDWQTEERIIDPDGCYGQPNKGYSEWAQGARWTNTGQRGFAAHNGAYADGENPFVAGRARRIKATKKDGKAYAKWQPNFEKAGNYAVYVSYQTVKGSVDDAHYTVFHQGQATEFRVNQRMGGGTWVYLGTFYFDRGDNIRNCVMLTNQSSGKGVVTADAVRFGGGMGNIVRGGSVSGLPRAVEGARYSAQWGGAPLSTYSLHNGDDDYKDDINARSLVLNWLGGSSVYMPSLSGKGVPMEMSLAIHSDAGYATDGQGLIGSLAISTTSHNDGRLNAGISRQASTALAEEVLAGATRDLTQAYGQWNRRYLWDRNYAETRQPEVPSAIFETLSHQNFPDMVLGQDPNFRFTLARSIYKSIARHTARMHGQSVVIAPLAPTGLRATLNGQKAVVAWTRQDDPYETTAAPTYYILYTAEGRQGFDNGQKVSGTSVTIDLKPGVQYDFKVTAANRGGESFPSEVVSVCAQPGATRTVLVVNGFTRLSAPAVVNTESQQGFDLDADPGVSYGATLGWSGRQICFDRTKMGIEGPGGLGYSGSELEGKVIAGNTFDYISTHADALVATGRYNVASASLEAVETGQLRLADYAAVDLILGLQRYMPQAVKYYKSFSASLQSRLSTYLQGGGRVLASGAYVGTDMSTAEETQWLRRYFHASPAGQVRGDALTETRGLGMQFDFHRTLNADHYAATHADALNAEDGGFAAMLYSNGLPAATAYNGADSKTFLMGFPLETVTSQTVRRKLMQGIMQFLLP